MLTKTLQLSEKEDGDKAIVTATFYLAENQPDPPGQVVWSKVDGAWKVSYIASKAGGWKLSGLECK